MSHHSACWGATSYYVPRGVTTWDLMLPSSVESGVCINTGLALRQGHHMGNVHKPALSLHLCFFFGLFVFQPAAVSVWSSFNLSDGQNDARQVKLVDSGRMDGVDWYSAGRWQCNRRGKIDQRLAQCWSICVVATVTNASLHIHTFSDLTVMQQCIAW